MGSKIGREKSSESSLSDENDKITEDKYDVTLNEELEQLKAKWTEEQNDMRTQVIETDISDKLSHKQFDLLGGLDISFIIGEESLACACYVILDSQMKVVYQNVKMVHLTAPYIPSYLAFREADSLVDLVDHQRKEKPHLTPDVLLVDGNGRLHPRLCGVACHIGLSTKIPTVGVAKNLYQVEMLAHELKRDYIKHRFKSDPELEIIELTTGRGEVLGVALSCKERVGGGRNPIFVSVGSGVSLDTSVWLVSKLSKYRVPEPTRQADQISREYLRNHHPTPDGKLNLHLTSDRQVNLEDI